MQTCEIYPVPFRNSFGWKWRHQTADGRVIESDEQYPLYYDCVSAAVARGYQPNVKCLSKQDRKTL
jgi:hypothetical protein